MNIQPVGSPVITKLEERQAQAAAGAAAQPAPPVSREELAGAVKKLNESMQLSAQSLEFSIDEDSKQIVVKIIDKNTHELLRQMPSKEALEMARSLEKMRGLLLHQTA